MDHSTFSCLGNDEHWFVQYCLFGPDRGHMAVMTATQAMERNITEATRNIPRNFWVTVGMACSEAEARKERTRISKRLDGNNQENPRNIRDLPP